MLSILLTCFSFLLPICLLVGASELRRKYRSMKEEAKENPGSVSEKDLKLWKWISVIAAIVFWAVIAMLAAIPALFFVAISFM